MSTLVAQTISNGTVSTSSANVIQGCAKAWVNFNGSTATIRASYNVGSIIKNGTGDYTVNFTNAFADTNYAAIQGAANSDGNDGNRIVRWQTFAQNTNSFRFQINGVREAFSAIDATNIHSAFFR